MCVGVGVVVECVKAFSVSIELSECVKAFSVSIELSECVKAFSVSIEVSVLRHFQSVLS